MILNEIINIIKSFFTFTGSYSNNVFKAPLSKEDEAKYLELHKSGDLNARNILIEHNLRLVAHIVKKYEYKLSDMDDLISIGTIGLIKGIDSFKGDKDTKLTTYCARCIENEILMHFRGNKKNEKNISLNEPIGFDKEGNDIELIDILKPVVVDMGEDLHLKNNIKLLSQYIDILTEREKTIIIMRYGLYNTDEFTQKEIASKLNISRSYVSRIEKRALTKILREFMKTNNDF